MAKDMEIRPNAVYTLAEVRTLLRISDATARRWLRSGKLPGNRIGRDYRILGSDILAALDQR